MCRVLYDVPDCKVHMISNLKLVLHRLSSNFVMIVGRGDNPEAFWQGVDGVASEENHKIAAVGKQIIRFVFNTFCFFNNGSNR